MIQNDHPCTHIIASSNHLLTRSDYLQGSYDRSKLIRYNICPKCKTRINWNEIQEAQKNLRFIKQIRRLDRLK